MNGIRHRSAPAERRTHQPELGLFDVKLTHNARPAEVDAQTPPEVFFCSPAICAPLDARLRRRIGGGKLRL
jgi:hypothetical protein